MTEHHTLLETILSLIRRRTEVDPRNWTGG